VDRISTGPEPEFGTSVVFLPKGGRHAIKDAPPTPTLPVDQVFGSGSCDRAREDAQPAGIKRFPNRSFSISRSERDRISQNCSEVLK